MISVNFGLWWSGGKISYLRYLTFKTLRHFNPHSRIELYTNYRFSTNKDEGHNATERQEYNDPKGVKLDYTSRLSELGVEIVKIDKFSQCSPNHQSDFFRWWFLKKSGGFYLDTDQIILKSFAQLPLNHEFIYSSYAVNSMYAPNGRFCPVGVLGAMTNSQAVNKIMEELPKYYDPNNYNCIGPLMFIDMEQKLDLSKSFNAPSSYFYPAAICDQMEGIFNGSLEFNKSSFSAHWFGGYGKSQVFNKQYTEEFANNSNDSISKFLRKKRLI